MYLCYSFSSLDVKTTKQEYMNENILPIIKRRNRNKCVPRATQGAFCSLETNDLGPQMTDANGKSFNPLVFFLMKIKVSIKFNYV